MIIKWSVLFFLLIVNTVLAQHPPIDTGKKTNHQMDLAVSMDVPNKTLVIEQKIVYTNNSNTVIDAISLIDWANSFSSKKTPLGVRFSEDFLKRFYFAKKQDRGYTKIKSIADAAGKPISWDRPKGYPDIIQVKLEEQLNSNQSVTIRLNYEIKLPNDRFTKFGFHSNGDFSLKYWYITPAVFDKKWQVYSNKNLDDLYASLSDFNIQFTLPKTYQIYTDLTVSEAKSARTAATNTYQLHGNNRNEVNVYLRQNDSFYAFGSNSVKLLSDIDDNRLMPKMKRVAATRILNFLEKNLGAFPFKKLLVSEIDYKRNPIYGFNQLPDILRPFPDGFQYEIKLLKVISEQYLDHTILLNPRKDYWLKSGLHIYLMMQYIQKYYPETKMVGNLSKIIGLRWFHAAKLDFNAQYYLAYKNIARQFLDQALSLPKDQLVKFNANLASAYKAGLGLLYLEDFIEDSSILPQSIASFYKKNKLKLTTSQSFLQEISARTKKDISWFYKDFIQTNQPLDFQISRVKKQKDSIQIRIKNNAKNKAPVSLYGLRDDKVVSKTWITNIEKSKTVRIPNPNLDKLALDVFRKIPEQNRRNNYKNLKWIFNRPFQFRLLQDVEDARYNQLFFIPEFKFNIYDGFTIGSTLYNKTFIRRPIDFKFTPFYGLKSKKLLGAARITYTYQLADEGLYAMRFGISGSSSSYAPDLLFRKISPSISFLFRPKDLRSNEKQSIHIRHVNVNRDRDPIVPVATPDYQVFNVRYRYTNVNLIHINTYSLDYQISKNFGKLAATYFYRKIFQNNRQINLRLFAGTFLFNNTQKDADFFSFALDRPTDYLFDFGYLGRSEDTGITSQEIKIAEGGFKSRLAVPFSNQWMGTINGNTNIWNWIYAYGDLGFVKNKGFTPKFVYDSGIRLSLVADYFELFFPVYSNKGWEIAQPNYEKQIRFIITLSPQTLVGLFTREWY